MWTQLGKPIREEFERLERQSFEAKDRKDYLCGTVLSYGFGEDGSGNVDALPTGKRSSQYALKRWKNRIWQCQYLDFGKADFIRLDPEVPRRSITRNDLPCR